MFRPVRTGLQARHGLLSDVHSPCGVWGITNWSLVASGGENFDKRCRDFRRRQKRNLRNSRGKKTQVSRPLFLKCTSEAVHPHQRCLLTVPETLCQALPGARSSVPRIHSRTHALPGERVLDREPLHPHTRTHDLKYFREAGNNK